MIWDHVNWHLKLYLYCIVIMFALHTCTLYRFARVAVLRVVLNSSDTQARFLRSSRSRPALSQSVTTVVAIPCLAMRSRLGSWRG